MNIPTYFFIFDVESIGLHGEGFAVAGGIWSADGTNIVEFAFHCHHSNAEGDDLEDRPWVQENVSIHAGSREYRDPLGVRDAFWRLWRASKELRPDLVMAVECGWPVEARFLEDCIADSPKVRNWEGPYPMHEIASFMLAAGMDPMATYVRRKEELPAHEPLADARLSARLLFSALKILDPERKQAVEIPQIVRA